MLSVIVFSSANASLGDVGTQLDRLGLAAHSAKNVREVTWLLAVAERKFAAIFIDGDSALPDRLELVSYLATSHPDVPRFLLLTAPSVAESEGCIVVDKLRIEDRVCEVLAALR